MKNSVQHIKHCFISAAASLMMLAISSCSQNQEQETAKLKAVPFRFQPIIGGVENVFVAGTFNDWSDSKDRMTDRTGDGIFETVLYLPEGQYEYKFVVDGKFITDMNADAISGSGRDGDNSVVYVDDRYDPVPFIRGDGKIETRDLPYAFNQRMVSETDNGGLEFMSVTFLPDVERVKLLIKRPGMPDEFREMKNLDSDTAYEYWIGDLPDAADEHFSFIFKWIDGGHQIYGTPFGFTEQYPETEYWYEYSREMLPPFTSPAWVRNGVFYQIFPERFKNGDPENDPDFSAFYYDGVTELPENGKTNGEYFHLIKDWNDIEGLAKSPYRTDGRPDYYSFYGGDIQGILEELPYLHDLGITIIYFNPLNKGKSNHKYDPVDYLSIDPHFGDEALFKTFVKKAHAYGIRIIVDKAFNHTGDYHYAFYDTKIKGPESEFWHWFEWNEWPLPEEGAPTPCTYYSCWWDFPAHPNLNFDFSRSINQSNQVRDISSAEPNLDVINHILSVADYWIGELGIDGFRLDVPNEVPFWFWKLFRERVNELNPDAFLIGEIWGDAMPWLGPDQFHSTMNYKYFREPVIRFFGLGSINAEAFDLALTPGRYLYPKQASQSMMNLIGSHDTKRFLALAEGDHRRLMLAALFQMTYTGVPAIYYGDEVALAGGDDPDNRRPFPWDWQDDPLRRKIHHMYKNLIEIRNKNSALRTGGFQSIYARKNIYAFRRFDDIADFIIVLNNDKSPARLVLNLPENLHYEDKIFLNMLEDTALKAENLQLRLGLQPFEGLILKVNE